MSLRWCIFTIELNETKMTTTTLNTESQLQNNEPNALKVEKYDNADLEDFTKNSRFKTAKSNGYIFFDINANNQIRITKAGAKRNSSYRVTFHERQEDGFFDGKIYTKNDFGASLQDAKKQAARFYFIKIRENVSDFVSI